MPASRIRPLSAVAALASVLVASFVGCGLDAQGTAERAGERCTTDAQCADDSPCTADACTADGVCTHTAAPDGDGPPSTQHPGSCQRSVCKAGALVVVPDDTNVSDDGETCTDDTCKDGKPVHPPKPDTTDCKVGQATGRCHAGACAVACGKGLPPCDDQNRCTDDTCDVAAGQCVFTPLDGVKLPGEKDVPGDCRTPRCVGGTEVPGAIDDTDLPAADSDCVTPTCTNGSPSTPAVGPGTACKGGSAVCDGQGTCVECNLESDCTGLPPSTACAVRACDAHVCKQIFTPNGTQTGLQTVGDCKVVVCDGAGTAVTQPDDADVPNDPNVCVTRSCKAGEPQTTPVAAGVACGAKVVCDGQGVCSGCAKAGDCPGTDDSCKKRTCVATKCGFDFKPAGTSLPAGEQKPGDCQDLACDGAGNVNSLEKNDDLPVDGNDCTGDVCTVGAPSNPPLAADTACAKGVCDGASACVECNTPAQCPAPPLCIAATCSAHACGTTPIAAGVLAPPAQQKPADCVDAVCDGKGGTTTAPNVNDLPTDGNDCTADTCTPAGVPVFSPSPAHTACKSNGGAVCDGKSACVGCVDNSDCQAPSTCNNAACACVKKTCAGLGATCGSIPDGCGGTLACNDKAKNGAETDVDCGGPVATCPQRCGKGKACAADDDCASGHCVDGVCCDKACAGSCEGCTTALSGQPNGTCGPIPAGKAPDPTKPACPNAGDVCGIAGVCACLDGVKDGAETDADCGGGACGACGSAKSCLANADCATGFCADGVCCDQACNAACNACTAALTGGVTGTCGPITEGTDPKNQCTLGAGGAEKCGVGGACQCSDGVKNGGETTVDCGGLCGKCSLGKACATNAECASGQCFDGVCCNVACGTPCMACTKALNGVVDGTCSPIAEGSAPKAACPKAGDLCGVGGKCGCADGAKGGLETDVDCGGGVCAACGGGKACGAPSDCGNTFCVDGFCCDKACNTTCVACAAALSVGANGTCADVKPGVDPHDTCKLGGGAEVCGPGHKCQCADGAKDGAETDVDCGGGVCNACVDGSACKIDNDCASGFCGPDALCHPATCNDKVKNGVETDVDCGGADCPKCASGKSCGAKGDCISDSCTGSPKTCG